MSADYLLIHSVKGGDTKAAETIIRKYYSKVFDYCKYHSADIHTAEDITQEVFLIFLKEIYGYKHHGKLLNYLYTIARNKCIDEKKKRHNADLSTECIVQVMESEATVLKNEIDHLLLKEAVDELPEEIREVVVLYYYLDIKQKEVANICGIGLPLVKYRLKQGKAMLKKYMEGGL
uniref:RNA polymerase sigma factor, sigma-70 family n=1 Tax=Eubacterium cellulosolvens (strain ATCC 43171 / JCM 9499 / 6) TaxID=633697 RepID=I5AR95_EUBC6